MIVAWSNLVAVEIEVVRYKIGLWVELSIFDNRLNIYYYLSLNI